MKYTFNAEIQKADRGAFVLFPYDLLECFGSKKQVKVKCEFDGEPYRGSLVNMGSGPCIGILKSIQEKINKEPGDTVKVVLWKDEEERIIEIPEDLQLELDKSSTAKNLFDSLSYSNKKLYVDWIATAKRSTTREERIFRTIKYLEQGIKNFKKGK